MAYSVSVSAQEYKQESDLIKSIIGKAKKDFVTSIIDIPDDKANAFWKYYNAYETHRQALGDKRLSLILAYAALYNSDDKKSYKDLVKDAMSIHKKYEKNLKKYYKHINKKVYAKTAMQFFQVEEYLRSTIESKLYDNLPIKR